MKWRMKIYCEDPPGHKCTDSVCNGRGRWLVHRGGFGGLGSDDEKEEWDECKVCGM